MARVISTLAGVPRFQSGMGDNNDLAVKVREDLEGGWFAVIHTGHYFIGTEEGYLFAERAALAFTDSTTGSVRTVATTGLALDPTRIGPIILRRAGNVRPLQRVCSPLRAFRPVTLVGAGEVKSFQVPGSGILVSVVSDPVTGVLLSVPATGDIISNQDYVYDPRDRRVYVRGASFPSLYVTYVVGEQDSELLKQEEIVGVDRDGKVRVQYKTVSMLPGRVPLIRKPTSVGTVYGSGVAVTGNVITFVTTGQISSGDICAVEYYVDNSFTAIPSGTLLRLQYLPAISGIYTLEYETADRQYYDTSLISSGSVDYIQLNPLLTQRESGFLYLADADEPWPTPSRLRITVANPNLIWDPVTSQDSVLTVRVFDSQGQALPNQRIVASATGSGSLAPAFPTNEITNGLGEVVYVWGADTSGLVTFTARVSGTAVSGVVNFFIRDSRYYKRQTEQQLGKLMLHMEDVPVRDNLYRVTAYYCYLDGAPFQADGSVAFWSSTVTFRSSRSKFYDAATGRPLPLETDVPMTLDSLATVLVDPTPGDMIRAEVSTPTTGRKRVAIPIRIPDENRES